MSAVYQDVIEGYLIASIKVFSKIDVLIYLNLNSETESTQKPQPFQLVGWFIFGSFLILKGALLNYLDNAYGESQVEEGVSNLLRRGRSLETKQETTLDDLTLLPWTKGADQEKGLFEYQPGVSGFIFMGLTSSIPICNAEVSYWSHPSKHLLSDGWMLFTHLAYGSELVFNPCLPCLHFTRSSILVLSVSATLSILCLRIKPQSAQDSIPIHISQSPVLSEMFEHVKV